MAKNNKQFYEHTFGTEKYKLIRNKAFTYTTHYYYTTGAEGLLI